MKYLYICEGCGRQFDNFEDANEHENSHIRPSSYLIQPGYLPHWPESPDQKYHFDIIVPMADGAKVRFTFACVVEEAIIKPEVTE